MKSKFTNFLSKKGIYVTLNPEIKYGPLFANKIHEQLIRKSKGIVHAGAHFGQEATLYGKYNKEVLWIEGDPTSFEILQKNILQFPMQKAVLAILGDADGKMVNFNISSNEGQSSSFFEFVNNKALSGITKSKTITGKMETLSSVVKKNNFSSANHLVLDLQGAELLVLNGLGGNLLNYSTIYIEVSTMVIYQGGAKYEEVKNFLAQFNFYPLWEPGANSHENLIFVRFSED